MNPACLLMLTGAAGIAASAWPGRVDSRQIEAGVTAGLIQTRLVMAGQRRTVARLRARRAGRRLRRMLKRP